MARPVSRAVIVLAVLALPAWAQGQTPAVNQRLAALEAAVGRLQGTVTALQAQVNALQKTVRDQRTELDHVRASEVLKLSPFVSVTTELELPIIRFTGVNLQLVNGVGPVQVEDPAQPNYYENPTLNGLGNLIIGYNETSTMLHQDLEVRTGSHNLVVGPGHTYSSYGGFVAGFINRVEGLYSTVSGGLENVARGHVSSVTGGQFNYAVGSFSSVSGGLSRRASQPYEWVAGAAPAPPPQP